MGIDQILEMELWRVGNQSACNMWSWDQGIMFKGILSVECSLPQVLG